MAEAEQQGQEAEKAESSEAEPAAAKWIGHNRKERCIKRIVRERHIKERLGKPAPAVAGETSAAAAEEVERVCRPGKPAPPAAGETSEAVADKPERLCRPDKKQARQARSADGWRDQRGGSGQGRAAVQDGRLQDTEAHQSDPQMLPRELSGSAGNSGWLHHQGS